MRRQITIAAFAALLIGCSSSVEPEEATALEKVGVIRGLSENTPAITLPDTARVGETLWVTIETRWPDGCSEFSRTSVQEVDGRFLVTPYDLDTGPLFDGCSFAPVFHTHTAALEFSEPGTGRVTIQGRSSPGTETLTTIPRFVTVVN